MLLNCIIYHPPNISLLWNDIDNLKGPSSILPFVIVLHYHVSLWGIGAQTAKHTYSRSKDHFYAILCCYRRSVSGLCTISLCRRSSQRLHYLIMDPKRSATPPSTPQPTLRQYFDLCLHLAAAYYAVHSPQKTAMVKYKGNHEVWTFKAPKRMMGICFVILL